VGIASWRATQPPAGQGTVPITAPRSAETLCLAALPPTSAPSLRISTSAQRRFPWYLGAPGTPLATGPAVPLRRRASLAGPQIPPRSCRHVGGVGGRDSSELCQASGIREILLVEHPHGLSSRRSPTRPIHLAGTPPAKRIFEGVLAPPGPFRRSPRWWRYSCESEHA